MFRHILSLESRLAGPASSSLRSLAPLLSTYEDPTTYLRPLATDATPAPEKYMDFPGGKVPFSAAMHFVGGPSVEASPIPCYRTLDSTGAELPDAAVPHPLDEATAVRMYRTMVALQSVDTIFYEAQRQVG